MLPVTDTARNTQKERKQQKASTQPALASMTVS
jgi:hypothetical protein